MTGDTVLAPGDVVRAPFPYVDQDKVRDRPAVVLATVAPTRDIDLVWAVMVTSATNGTWAGDVSLELHYRECGLPVPCVVRTAKIATFERKTVSKVGKLPEAIWRQLLEALPL